MKPQVLHRVISQNFFIKQSAVESWDKIKKLKDILFKDLSAKKIKKIVSNFCLKSY